MQAALREVRLLHELLRLLLTLGNFRIGSPSCKKDPADRHVREAFCQDTFHRNEVSPSRENVIEDADGDRVGILECEIHLKAFTRFSTERGPS